ncbi:plasmid partitioning protein RepB, partial [Rhizobium phaseoli]
MLIVMRQVPLDLINAIGAAPDIGRRRWLELGERLEKADVGKILAELSADDARRMSSDERFQRALVLATKTTAVQRPAVARTEVSGVPVMIKKTAAGATFVFDGKMAPGFDQFVQERLQSLFQEFKKHRGA